MCKERRYLDKMEDLYGRKLAILEISAPTPNDEQHVCAHFIQQKNQNYLFF